MPPRLNSKRKLTRKPARKARGAWSALIPVTERDRVAGRWFAKLVALQARLYGPGGCPWDREQTHESLRKYLIEETYEVLDAMDLGHHRKFAGELGDLLLQVIFHSILAEESGHFTISEVIESIHSKMVRRHPHVFGDVDAKNSAEVLKNWERIKAVERAKEAEGAPSAKGSDSVESILAGVPRSLPALLEAYQLSRRAAHVGFDWDNLADIFAKLEEEKRELQEEMNANIRPADLAKESSAARKNRRGRPRQALTRLEEEVGDLLFVGANVARFLGVDPEIALKKANSKFKKRFNWMEQFASREGHLFADLARDRKEKLWDESKRNT